MGGEHSLQDWRKRDEENKSSKNKLQSSPVLEGKKSPTVKTYSDLSWLELLEMFCQLFFAAKLDLTLWTFIIYVRRCLSFFAGKYLP